MHDRRECQRSLENVNVRLYKNDEFMSLAESLNLTPFGMFIHTDVLLFPKGAVLDITVDDPKNLKRYRKRGKIVHRSLEGIGVEFLQADSQENNLNFMRLLNCSNVVSHVSDQKFQADSSVANT